MGLRKWISRGRKTKLFHISKSEKVSNLEPVPPPIGKELSHEISSRWTTQLNGLHEQYRNGLIENGEYLQGVLDGVADWGTELCDAVDAGRMSVVYLALWHEKADELHRDWKAARNKLKTILKQGGIV